MNLELGMEDMDMAEYEEQSKDLLALRFLNKNNARFTRTPGGFVSLEHDGKVYNRVYVYRMFPFTDPNHYISIREADEKAREIGVIKDLKSDLIKDEYEMLIEQLKLRYFTPVITKIHDIKEEYGYAYFNVTTNFGICKFTAHMGSSVARLSETRLIITDLDGNRYEIPDLNKYTQKELNKLDVFI